MIPTVIGVMAVAIILAIRFVMLVVIADDVVQREAVMGRDEVNARLRFATDGARRPSSPFQNRRITSRYWSKPVGCILSC